MSKKCIRSHPVLNLNQCALVASTLAIHVQQQHNKNCLSYLAELPVDLKETCAVEQKEDRAKGKVVSLKDNVP